MFDMNYPCSKCGCTGIHACPGKPIPPISEEEAEKLYALIEILYNEEKSQKDNSDV